MKAYIPIVVLLIFSLVIISHTSVAQNPARLCPEGEQPIFTRVHQIDSFHMIYPDCEEYNFYGYYNNGVPIDPPQERRLPYVLTLFTILGGLLLTTKLLFKHTKFFN